MSVERREVERIAALARLSFDDQEMDRLTAEMNQILDHVEVLRGLADLQVQVGVAPVAESEPSRPTGPDALKVDIETMAPRWSDGFFVVPPPPGMRDDGGL